MTEDIINFRIQRNEQEAVLLSVALHFQMNKQIFCQNSNYLGKFRNTGVKPTGVINFTYTSRGNRAGKERTKDYKEMTLVIEVIKMYYERNYSVKCDTLFLTNRIVLRVTHESDSNKFKKGENHGRK